MLKIALIYGAIAGSISIAVMVLSMHFGAGPENPQGAQLFGYAIMLAALTLIFIGVKHHRDRALGGAIKFAPAFGLGAAIAAITGVFYVIGWEINLAMTDYAFMDNYAKGVLAAKEKAGIAGEELQKAITDLQKMTAQYKNPAFRLPVTFLEIFPIGLVMALISAAILRNPKAFAAR